MYDAHITEAANEARRILAPRGYKILIAMPVVKEKSKGGIYIPDELKDREHAASIVGTVIAMGDTAYRDEARFPTGAWCKMDDHVVFRSYSGVRFKVMGQEFRLVNDDSIEGVVEEPSMIERA